LNGCGSRIQPSPGDVCQQMRASLLRLTHQYQGAGPASTGAAKLPTRISSASFCRSECPEKTGLPLA
jgi:hypothetical protein